MPLFILMTRLCKATNTQLITSGMLGYRLAPTKDEAIGSFVTKCLETKPGYSIDEILSMEIPTDVLQQALKEAQHDQDSTSEHAGSERQGVPPGP